MKESRHDNDIAWMNDIDDMLTFMSLFDRCDVNVPDPSYWDGAIRGTGSQITAILESVGRFVGSGDPGWREHEAAANKLRGVVGAMIYSGSPGSTDRYEFIGGRELDYKTKSRIVPFLNASWSNEGRPARIDPFASRVVEVRGGTLGDDGRCRSTFKSHWYNFKSRWFTISEAKWVNGGNNSYESMAFQVVVGAAVACKMRWRVEIRLADGLPSISMFTDPTGVREFFRFRDVPEGKSRRAALRHWVTQHWRRDRYNEADEIYVREHLRGATEFRWHGMDVKINIPDCDIARVEAGRIERRRLSDAGLTRRLREARKAGKI